MKFENTKCKPTWNRTPPTFRVTRGRSRRHLLSFWWNERGKSTFLSQTISKPSICQLVYLVRSCFWSSIKQSSLGHLKCNQEADLTWSDPVSDSHRCPVLLLTGRREGRESLMYNCHHFQLVIDHVLFFAIVTDEGLLPPSENMSRSLTAGVVVFFFLWFSTCCQKFCPTLPHPNVGTRNMI